MEIVAAQGRRLRDKYSAKPARTVGFMGLLVFFNIFLSPYPNQRRSTSVIDLKKFNLSPLPLAPLSNRKIRLHGK